MEKTTKQIKKIKKQGDFLTWLTTLKDYQLLDLMMNCGFLLGRTVKPPFEPQPQTTEGDTQDA